MSANGKLVMSADDWQMIILALRKASIDITKEANGKPIPEAAKMRRVSEWWVNLSNRLEQALPKQGILLPPGVILPSVSGLNPGATTKGTI